MKEYVVREGDTISSIAYRNGLFWRSVWDYPDNNHLKNMHRDPEILFPGDIVYIPDKKIRIEDCETGSRHSFRRIDIPEKLHLQFLEDNEPRANEDYVLNIDGVLKEGVLDDDGFLDEDILPSANLIKIRLGEDEEYISLKLGTVEPIDVVAGVQNRLNNLGYFAGAIDNILGEKTISALKRFQKDMDLKITGKPDQETKDKLLEADGV